MSAEIHAIVRAQILEAAEFYAKDLRALPEVELTHDRGARLPIDITYEVVMVNRRLASRLRGQEPDPSTKENGRARPLPLAGRRRRRDPRIPRAS